MQLEIGSVHEGKVVEIAKFGAFVEVEGKTGMVHISEISNTYVSEIREHVQVGQMVKVKVINITEDGKISLSIKKAMPVQESRKRSFNDKGRNQPDGRTGSDNRNFQSNRRGLDKNPKPRDVNAPPPEFDSVPAQTRDASFEDMLSRFKQTSEEKFSDLKRIQDNKRRAGARRK